MGEKSKQQKSSPMAKTPCLVNNMGENSHAMGLSFPNNKKLQRMKTPWESRTFGKLIKIHGWRVTWVISRGETKTNGEHEQIPPLGRVRQNGNQNEKLETFGMKKDNGEKHNSVKFHNQWVTNVISRTPRFWLGAWGCKGDRTRILSDLGQNGALWLVDFSTIGLSG